MHECLLVDLQVLSMTVCSYGYLYPFGYFFPTALAPVKIESDPKTLSCQQVIDDFYNNR